MASQQNLSSAALSEVSPQELHEVQGGHPVYFRFGRRIFFLRHRDFFRGFGRFRHIAYTQILGFPFPFRFTNRG